MGICGSKPDGAGHQASASSAAAAPRAPKGVAPVPAVHSDIINDAVVGGGATEILTSSEDGTCVLYDWKQGKAVRSVPLSLSLSSSVSLCRVRCAACTS